MLALHQAVQHLVVQADHLQLPVLEAAAVLFRAHLQVQPVRQRAAADKRQEAAEQRQTKFGQLTVI